MANKKIIKFMFLILIVILVIIFFKSKIFNSNYSDEILFFKIFSRSNRINSQDKTTYKFNVKYKNKELKEINLSDTILNKSNAKEKIAPRYTWYV